MPSRHISPQSFDEILSELGDDPAIPDPQGFRKPSNPQIASKKEVSAQISHPVDLKKIALFAGLGVGLICLVFTSNMAYESMKLPPANHLEAVQNELTEVKNDLKHLRDEMLEMESDLNDSMDLIEVSIHSLNKTKPSSPLKPKLQTIPFEAELSRWRYLGLSRISATQQAFFHNGQRALMLEKGGVLLGDWRLSHIDREAAILTHPQGKTLTLKPSKSE